MEGLIYIINVEAEAKYAERGEKQKRFYSAKYWKCWENILKNSHFELTYHPVIPLYSSLLGTVPTLKATFFKGEPYISNTVDLQTFSMKSKWKHIIWDNRYFPHFPLFLLDTFLTYVWVSSFLGPENIIKGDSQSTSPTEHSETSNRSTLFGLQILFTFPYVGLHGASDKAECLSPRQLVWGSCREKKKQHNTLVGNEHGRLDEMFCR